MSGTGSLAAALIQAALQQVAQPRIVSQLHPSPDGVEAAIVLRVRSPFGVRPALLDGLGETMALPAMPMRHPGRLEPRRLLRLLEEDVLGPQRQMQAGEALAARPPGADAPDEMGPWPDLDAGAGTGDVFALVGSLHIGELAGLDPEAGMPEIPEPRVAAKDGRQHGARLPVDLFAALDEIDDGH